MKSTIPGFDAEASLSKAISRYQAQYPGSPSSNANFVKPSLRGSNPVLDVICDVFGIGCGSGSGSGGGGGGAGASCPTEPSLLNWYCFDESRKCAVGVRQACFNVQMCCGGDAG